MQAGEYTFKMDADLDADGDPLETQIEKKESTMGSSLNSPKDEENTNKPASLRKSKCKNVSMVEEFCVFCYGTSFGNDEAEELLRCSECLKFSHPKCLEMPDVAVENTKLYDWQCNDCKGCFHCKKKNKAKSIILCDFCDRGFHTFCLERKPTRFSRGSWKCPMCQKMESSKQKYKQSESYQESQRKSDNNEETLKSNVDDCVKESMKSDCSAESNESITITLSPQWRDVSINEDVADCNVERTELLGVSVKADVCSLEKETTNESQESVEINTQEKSNSQGKIVFLTDEKREDVMNNPLMAVPDSLEVLCRMEADKNESEEMKELKEEINENQLKLRYCSNPTSLINEDQNIPVCNSKNELDISKIEDNKTRKVAKRESRRVSRRMSGLPAPAIKESNYPIEYNLKCYKKRGRKQQSKQSENFDSKTISASNKVSEGSDAEVIPDSKTSVVNTDSTKMFDVQAVPDEKNDANNASDKKLDGKILKSSKRSKSDHPNLDAKTGFHKVLDGKVLSEQCLVNAGSESCAKEAVSVDESKVSNASHRNIEDGKILKVELIENQNTVESPPAIVRKRGRPRKSITSKNETVKSPLKQSKNNKVDSKLSSVLRRSAREPSITPATSKSVTLARDVRKVYPVRDRDQPRSASSPRRASISSPHSKGAPSPPVKRSPLKSPKAMKTPPKTPVRSSPRTSMTPKQTEEQKTPKHERKQNSTPLKRSLVFSEKKEQDSVKKRKLSSPNNTTNTKKPKTADDAIVKTRRRSRKDVESSADVTCTDAATGLADIESFVSSSDIALFEQAQLAVKNDSTIDDGTAIDQRIKKVDFGDYEIDTWYSSPYPSEYKIIGKVFICEYCLKYMKSATILRRHMAKCLWRHPPGDEIYRKDNTSVFEVDGEKSPTYCQNLCLLAKLFLDHKTLYYEVEPFLFYVMTIADNSGCHIVGYFSKEKVSFLNYNVSCILVLPQFMRKGYGNVLIDFSYSLSRAEGKIGSPERPLSDLGLISYRSYWKHVLFRYLSSYNEDSISIKDMSQRTAVLSNDLISTMQALGILKYWKGEHVITLPEEMLDSYHDKFKSRKLKLEIDESCLKWTCKDYGQSKNKLRST